MIKYLALLLVSAAPIRKLGFVVTGTVPGQRDAYGGAYSYGYGYKTSEPSGDAAAAQRARSRRCGMGPRIGRGSIGPSGGRGGGRNQVRDDKGRCGAS